MKFRNSIVNRFKFRAWHLEEKTWLKNFIIDADFNRVDWDFYYTYYERSGAIGKEVILQQFTGFLDKNKKEIYEGDVIKYPGTDLDAFLSYSACNAQIIWRNCFALKSKIFDWDLNEDFCKKLEVIGNVYDNPDLLK